MQLEQSTAPVVSHKVPPTPFAPVAVPFGQEQVLAAQDGVLPAVNVLWPAWHVPTVQDAAVQVVHAAMVPDVNSAEQSVHEPV